MGSNIEIYSKNKFKNSIQIDPKYNWLKTDTKNTYKGRNDII